jgi:peroxiredoxin (alkyl hydroperoxide reductase subunit C)
MRAIVQAGWFQGTLLSYPDRVMIQIGQPFPSYSLTATVSLDKDKAFQTIADTDYSGKWKLYFFWPKDFTFVCPTEIAGFAKLNKEFLDRDVQILGASIDSEFVHLAWRNNHDDLRNLPFPMLADIKRELSSALGILDANAGVDPEGIVRFIYVTDLSVGRNPEEVLRVVDALQTDELCPCNWKKGESTLQV